MHKEIIVTVDIGSSKIVAAAGKKDDKGVISISAIETESSGAAVRRGQIDDVDKISNIIESLTGRINRKLNGNISKIYVGVNDQSGKTTSNIDYIAKKNDMEIAGYIINPEATAVAVLTETEKNLGCALIEFGAGLTHLSVYKDGLLKDLVSLPLGGSVITKDIGSLQISEEEAENLKTTYGSALITVSDENNAIKNIKLQNREIEIEQLNDIIEARTDEIIANIKNLLELSGFSGSIASGIVITGGMAALKNLAESIEEKTNQKVRVAHVKNDLIDAESSGFGQTFGNEAIIGLLSLGTENCFKAKEVEKPVIQPTTDMFGNDINQNNKERGTRKLPGEKPTEEKKDKNSIFSRITRRVEKKVTEVSRDLFETVDSTDENENESENEEKI